MALFDSINELTESRRRTSRRRFLIGGGSALTSWALFRWWRFRARPVVNRITKYCSTNQEFYTVALNEAFIPAVDINSWKLELVNHAGEVSFLTYSDLQQLENRRVFKTFVCVGNEIGGPLMNNAEWTVTPLAPIARRLAGDATTGRIMFYGLDGFYSSVPLEVALDDLSFIAYGMNGDPLPDSHGYPARVLFPGRYGMKQPRWLSRVEYVKAAWFKGYWESRGFSDDGRIRIQARIDYCVRQAGGQWLVTGVAVAGTKAVSLVEVSFDDGRTWKAAEITSPTLRDAWCTWSAVWEPLTPGGYTLIARVTAEGGERQIESNSTSFPSGSSGLHRVSVTV